MPSFLFLADPPESNGVNKFVLAGMPVGTTAQTAADYAVKYGLTRGKTFKVAPLGAFQRPQIICQEITGNVEITRQPNSAPASRDEVELGENEVVGALPIDTGNNKMSEPAIVDGEHAEDEETGTGVF